KKHATAADPWAKAWMAKTPQDGGYFTVSSAVTNQQITLSANKSYPGPNPANVSTIQMPVVPSTANLELQMQNGTVDIALGLSPRDITYLASKPGIEIISAPSQNMVQLPMLTT